MIAFVQVEYVCERCLGSLTQRVHVRCFEGGGIFGPNLRIPDPPGWGRFWAKAAPEEKYLLCAECSSAYLKAIERQEAAEAAKAAGGEPKL